MTRTTVRIRKFLSMLLTVAMITSCFGVSVYAEDDASSTGSSSSSSDSGGSGESSDSGGSGESSDSGGSGESSDSGGSGESSDSGGSGESSDSGGSGESSDNGNSDESSDNGNSDESSDNGNSDESSDNGNSDESSDNGNSDESSDNGNSDESSDNGNSDESNDNGNANEPSDSSNANGTGSSDGVIDSENSSNSGSTDGEKKPSDNNDTSNNTGSDIVNDGTHSGEGEINQDENGIINVPKLENADTTDPGEIISEGPETSQGGELVDEGLVFDMGTESETSPTGKSVKVSFDIRYSSAKVDTATGKIKIIDPESGPVVELADFRETNEITVESSGKTMTLAYHNEPGNRYIEYSIPAGGQITTDLEMFVANGITPDGTFIEFEFDKENQATGENDNIKTEKLKLVYTASSQWEVKKESNVKDTIPINAGGNIISDVTYTVKANPVADMEDFTKGRIFTKECQFTDTLDVPKYIIFPEGDLTAEGNTIYAGTGEQKVAILQMTDDTQIKEASLKKEEGSPSQLTFTYERLNPNPEEHMPGFAVSYQLFLTRLSVDTEALDKEVNHRAAGNMELVNTIKLSTVNYVDDIIVAPLSQVKNAIKHPETSVVATKSNSVIHDPDNWSESELEDASNANVVRNGDVIQYTIQVNNAGKMTANNVTVLDNMIGQKCEILQEEQYSAKPDGAVIDGNKISWNNQTLAPSDTSYEYTFYVRVKDAKTGDKIENVAIVNGTDTNKVENPVDKSSVDLSIQKVHDKGTEKITKNDVITYTITVTNNGTKKAEDVTVVDQFEKGEYIFGEGHLQALKDEAVSLGLEDTQPTVEYAARHGFKEALSKITWTGLTIEPGKSVELHVTVKHYRDPDTWNRKINNTAIVTHDSLPKEGLTAEVLVQTKSIGKLAWSKRYDELDANNPQPNFDAKKPISYFIYVMNEGDADYNAAGLTFKDILPVGFKAGDTFEYAIIDIGEWHKNKDTSKAFIAAEKLDASGWVTTSAVGNDQQELIFTIPDEGENSVIIPSGKRIVLRYTTQLQKEHYDKYGLDENGYSTSDPNALTKFTNKLDFGGENPKTVDGSFVIPTSALKINKTADWNNTNKNILNVSRGDQITYTLTIQNTTDAPVKGVIAEDVLPSGVRWKLDENVIVDKSDNDDFVQKGTMTLKDIEDGQQQLTWENLEIPAKATLVQNITLQYPFDSTEFDKLGGGAKAPFYNKFRINKIKTPVTITHQKEIASMTIKKYLNQSVFPIVATEENASPIIFTLDGFGTKTPANNVYIQDPVAIMSASLDITQILSGNISVKDDKGAAKKYRILLTTGEKNDANTTVLKESEVNSGASQSIDLTGVDLSQVKYVIWDFGDVSAIEIGSEKPQIICQPKENAVAGPFTNMVNLFYDGKDTGADVIGELTPPPMLKKQAFVNGALANNTDNRILTSQDVVTFYIDIENKIGGDMNLTAYEWKDTIHRTAISSINGQELRDDKPLYVGPLTVVVLDENGNDTGNPGKIQATGARIETNSDSFAIVFNNNAILPKGQTLRLSYEAVPSSEYQKAAYYQQQKETQSKYHIHNQVQFTTMATKYSQSAQTDYYYPDSGKNVFIQKGIVSTGTYENGTFTPSDSTEYYIDEKGAVMYSVVVYNSDYSKEDITIDSIVDLLPKGFTLEGIAPKVTKQGFQASIKTATSGTPVSAVGKGSKATFVSKSISAAGTTDRVTFNVGDKLSPGQAISFVFVCSIDPAVADSNRWSSDGYYHGESINNIAVSIPFGEDVSEPIPVEKGSYFQTKGFSGTGRDDTNPCIRVEGDTYGPTDGLAWFESKINVKPMKLGPSVKKEHVEYYMSDGAHTDWENLTPGNSIKWKITVGAANEGSNMLPMRGFELVDKLPAPFVLDADKPVTMKIFDSKGNVQQELNLADKYSVTTPAKDDKGNVIESQYITWQINNDVVVPAGGSASIEFVAKYDSKNRKYISYENEVYLYPQQIFESVVGEGKSFVDSQNTGRHGVRNSDRVLALGQYSSVSYTEISGIGTTGGTVAADGRVEGQNYISLGGIPSVEGEPIIVDYTLHVQNTSKTNFKDLVLINKMPHIGDSGVVNHGVSRDSEFNIFYAKDPEVTVYKVLENGQETPISGARVDFSTQEQYYEEDFKGTTTWSGSIAEGQWAETKAMRITLPKEFQLDQKAALRVHFKGQVDPNTKLTDSEMIAWDSFGCRYTANGSEVWYEPERVGAKLDKMPKAQISVHKTDETGKNILAGAEFAVYSENPDLAENEVQPVATITTTGTLENGYNGISEALTIGTYYVKEIEAPVGYFTTGQVYEVTLTAADANGIVPVTAEDDSTVIKNSKTPELSFVKTVTGGTEAMQEGDSFIIRVDGKFTDTQQTYKEFTIDKDKLDVPQPVTGVIYGESYTISELGADGYTVVIDQPTVQLNESVLVTVTNTPAAKATLGIEKHVLDGTEYPLDNMPENFEFKIQVEGKFSDTEETVKYVTFNAKDELNGQKVKMIEGVIPGESYVITELDAAGFQLSEMMVGTAQLTDGTVELQAGDEVIVSVFNEKEAKATLGIEKHVLELDGTEYPLDNMPDDFSFTIQVEGKFSDTEETVKYVTFSDKNELNGQEVKTIEGVIPGESYVITELDAAGFQLREMTVGTAQLTNGTVELQEDDEVVVAVFNEKVEEESKAYLGIEKYVEDGTEDALSRLPEGFAFIIKVAGKFSDTEETVKTVVFHDKAELNGGGIKEISGIIPGEVYTITEENAAGFRLKQILAGSTQLTDGRVTFEEGSENVVTVVNEPVEVPPPVDPEIPPVFPPIVPPIVPEEPTEAGLYVRKVVEGTVDENAIDFVLRISGIFEGDTEETEKVVRITSDNIGDMIPVEGVITGQTYTVTEDAADGFETTIDHNNGVVIFDGEEILVTVTNTPTTPSRPDIQPGGNGNDNASNPSDNGSRPRPRPPVDDTITIEPNEVPLAPPNRNEETFEELIIGEEPVPLAELPATEEELITLEEEPVPLSALPVANDDFIIIDDEPTPLADMPMTGDSNRMTYAWLLMVCSAFGLLVMADAYRKRKLEGK